MHILLATPSYGGLHAQHVAAMMRLQAWLLGRGVQVGVTHHEMAEVARSRNVIATRFWEQAELTHLLFVDSDITFAVEAVEALIRAQKPLVGCVYPRRMLDLARFAEAARRYDDLASVRAATHEFVVVPGSESADVEDGRCRVEGIGMGLALIERTVFARLIETGQIKKDEAGGRVSGTRGPVLGFFDPIPTETTFLAEDLSFCERWRNLCGGEVWAVLDQEIGHIGTMTYRARVIDALALGGEGS